MRWHGGGYVGYVVDLPPGRRPLGVLGRACARAHVRAYNPAWVAGTTTARGPPPRPIQAEHDLVQGASTPLPIQHAALALSLTLAMWM